MDRRVDVRHFVHRRSCDISSSNMAAYERWPRVCGRGTKYITEVCRMTQHVVKRRRLCRVRGGGGFYRPPAGSVGGYIPLLIFTDTQSSNAS